MAKPLVVRSFPLLQNENYVVARGSVEALRHLRPGDPFVLLRRNEAGVEITVARLRVHQPTASGEDLVYFQVVRTTTEDVAHLSGLTGVVGIKGYTLAMGIELDGIPAMDFAQVAEAIPYLAAGLTRIRGS